MKFAFSLFLVFFLTDFTSRIWFKTLCKSQSSHSGLICFPKSHWMWSCCRGNIRGVAPWHSPISKTHTLTHTITLQVSVVCTYSHRHIHPLGGLGTYPSLSVPFSNCVLIKAMVQLRTHFFLCAPVADAANSLQSCRDNTVDILHCLPLQTILLCFSGILVFLF